MSASCQSIDSVLELCPIHASAKLKSVKEPETEIPPVELVAELVEIELKELGFYVMVGIKYAPLGVADGNVYPWQDFPDTLFVVRNDGPVRGYSPVLIKGGIAAEPVRGHIGVTVRPLLNLAGNGGGLEIVDDLHLYMPDGLGRTEFLVRKRLGPAAFRQDKDGGLALASAPTLERTVFLLLRRFGGEEALVYLHIPMKYMTAFALAHHVTQLVNHFPYGLVTLAPELALYLLGRYGTLGGRQEEHGRKPVTYRQMAALHHRTRTELHLMSAIHARPGLVARIPAQTQPSTLATVQTVVFTEFTQRRLTRGFVRILTVKIKQVHIVYVFMVIHLTGYINCSKTRRSDILTV